MACMVMPYVSRNICSLGHVFYSKAPQLMLHLERHAAYGMPAALDAAVWGSGELD